MIQVSQQQMDGLAEDRLRQFVQELSARARMRHGETVAALDDASLSAMLEREVRAARRLGLKRRTLMERFTDLSICFGAGYHETQGWAARIFADTDLYAEARLDKVEKTAVFVLRGT